MDIRGNSAVPNPTKFFGALKQKQNDKYCHIYFTICSQQLPTSSTLQNPVILQASSINYA